MNFSMRSHEGLVLTLFYSTHDRFVLYTDRRFRSASSLTMMICRTALQQHKSKSIQAYGMHCSKRGTFDSNDDNEYLQLFYKTKQLEKREKKTGRYQNNNSHVPPPPPPLPPQPTPTTISTSTSTNKHYFPYYMQRLLGYGLSFPRKGS